VVVNKQKHEATNRRFRVIESFFLIPKIIVLVISLCHGRMNMVLQSIALLFRISNADSKPRFVAGSGVLAPRI
jgi:hypothetical protein